MFNLSGLARNPVARSARAHHGAGTLEGLMNAFSKTLLAVAIASAALATVLSADPVATPSVISGIQTHGTNLLVTVRIPAGTRRVTLESRSKFMKGTWTPRGVAMPGASDTEVSFTVPATGATGALRAVTDDVDSLPLPAPFYSGVRSFDPQVSASQPSSTTPGTGGPTTVDTSSPGAGGGAFQTQTRVRAVSESDIWKFSGTNLYFFNQLRGLQVIDVSTPARPVLRGRLPMTSYGEQMHVLPAAVPGGDWLALITQKDCQWDTSEVLVVRSADGIPSAGPRVPVPGHTLESRLIGDVLILASQGWTNRTVLVTNVLTRYGGDVPASSGGGNRQLVTNVFSQVYSEPFTQVTSIDLADPANPVVRSSVRAPAAPTAIHATDRLLFVSTQAQASYGLFGWDWSSDPASPTNTVLVFDVSDPSGNISLSGAFNTAGRVADKFKFGLDGDVLSIVSQVDGRWTSAAGRFEPPVVALETFSVASPSAPVRLGRLNLVTNESVFATRFDTGRAYVVTFRQVDPLWVVDLSDPVHPRVRGELQVPGWSSYIEPMGDRLLAMGVEQGRAAVSLFDVANPDAPALLSKVFLGDGWSWSEAGSDDKAFRVFPDQGLVLLPWYGRLGTNAWFQGIQLLDYSRSSLALRGTIDHDSTARRAALLGGHVLSLSSGELLSADIADRDHPAVRTVVDLSRPVDRVFVAGDRLVQIATGRWQGGSQEYGALTVSLSTAEDPDTVLSSLSLTNSPLIGADFRDGRLYLLQRGADSYRTEPTLQTNTEIGWRYVPPIVRMATNEAVRVISLPPLEVCSNIVRTVVFPGSPGVPAYETNLVVTRCSLVPRPPILETNLVVTRIQESQPPVLETNRVVVTNLVTIQIPGTTRLQVVGVDSGGLRPLGSTGTTNTLGGWAGAWKSAYWPSPGVVVFAGTGGGAYPMFMADVALPVGAFSSLPWGWFGGGDSRLLAFDVSQPDAPVLASDLELDAGSSRTFLLAGPRLYSSVSVSEWAPPSVNSSVTNRPDVFWWDRFGSWRTRYSLQVVDYSDASEPVVRDPIPLPGELVGLSHGGNLLYARTNAWNVSGISSGSLSVLAYDGIGASLVAARELPDGGTGALFVRPDGRILVGLRSRAVLETWALSREGTLETYGTTVLPGVASRFLEIGPLLVAETDDSLALVDGSRDPAVVTGIAARSCSLWLDPSTTAAAGPGALWVPRGDPGLWRVAFGPP